MILSIIIPLYNKEQYIGKCLDSVLDQNLPVDNYETIVLDDGSTDKSVSIAKKYAENHSNVHFFSHANMGVSATRNRGIDMAQGKFIYFLDADDYLASNVLMGLTEISKSTDLEILVFNSLNVSDYTHTVSTKASVDNTSLEVMDGISYIGKRGYSHEAWRYIIDRSFLLNTGLRFVEGRIAEDAIFSPNILLKANRVARVNLDVHRFVKVENSIQTSTSYKHTLKFVDDMVFAINEIDLLKRQVKPRHDYYKQAVMTLGRKQQAIVFALFIKVFNCPPYEISRLNNVLAELKKLGVYPLNKKLGGFGSNKTRFIFTNFIVPILNNKTLFYLILRFNRKIVKN